MKTRNDIFWQLRFPFFPKGLYKMLRKIVIYSNGESLLRIKSSDIRLNIKN